ncbi:FlhC family transcriptional regulator [Paracidovorax citrulli]|uniref:FlhC family transcriptional regulator n=1 Tax=Paracidovorax citrulli TaxID=80869 RepID=UPI003FA72E20
MLAQINSWVVARDLIQAKLRLTIVHSLTGLSIPQLRNLWRDIHQDIPRKGKLPESSLSFMTNRSEAAQLSAFVGVHLQLFGEPSSNPEHLLMSWQAHRGILGELDINACYFALRDVRTQIVNFIRCQKCDGQYIHDLGSHLTSRCPHCGTDPVN